MIDNINQAVHYEYEYRNKVEKQLQGSQNDPYILGTYLKNSGPRSKPELERTNGSKLGYRSKSQSCLFPIVLAVIPILEIFKLAQRQRIYDKKFCKVFE